MSLKDYQSIGGGKYQRSDLFKKRIDDSIERAKAHTIEQKDISFGTSPSVNIQNQNDL